MQRPWRYAGLVSLVLSCCQVVAQVPAPPPIKLTVHPAAEPVPALRFSLLPTLLELKPGNAAPLYIKVSVPLTYGQKIDGDLADKMETWRSLPIAELPRDEVRQALAQHEYALEQLEIAARRDRCDWELPLRDGRPWAIRLPEVQGLRNLARILALRVRLAIAEGDVDAAVRDLQTGFAMARHVTEGPLLINGLVGAAIAGLMLDQVEALQQLAGGPNLYWALMSLPRPMIDLRGAIQTEMYWVMFAFPDLVDIEQAKLGPLEWQRATEDIYRALAEVTGGPQSGRGVPPLAIAAAIKTYPEAKRYLIEKGHTPAEVEAMPVSQVVWVYTLDRYRQLRDNVFKWSFVPYWQIGDAYERAEREISKAESVDAILFAAFLPATKAALTAQVRQDRRIALLAAVEAVRMHAAAHGGKPPAALADIDVVPVLDDPSTGTPFSYRASGQTFSLSSPPLGGHRDEAREYEVTVK